MKKLVPMRHALTSPDYFGGEDMLGGPSWAGWRVLLLSIMGEVLTDEERALFQTFTGREREPQAPVREFTGIVGRRGGKSRGMGTLGAYLATCIDYRGILAPGQRGRLPIIAAAKPQADEVFSYLHGAVEQSKALRPLIENTVDRTLSLKSRIDVEVKALNFRTLRSGTNIGVILDECAFYRSDESASPDVEVEKAVKPSLATTHGPLIRISSPYAKKGILWTAFVRDYGPDGRDSRLVAKAPTTALNPGIDPAFLADAMEDDPVAYASEYGAEWRDDISSFIDPEVVATATFKGRVELPPEPSITYRAFVDVASGSGADSFTAGIAHSRTVEGQAERVAVLDLLFEAKPPFSPDAVIEELCAVLKRYGIRKVVGDSYGGMLPRERFEIRGITYEQSSKQHVPSMSKSGDSGPLYRSEIYKQFLTLMNSGRVELLDNRKMTNQLLSLERHVTNSGSDSITHPKGGHDDCINSAAGACVLVAHERQALVITDEMIYRFSKPASRGPSLFPPSRHGPRPMGARRRY